MFLGQTFLDPWCIQNKIIIYYQICNYAWVCRCLYVYVYPFKARFFSFVLCSLFDFLLSLTGSFDLCSPFLFPLFSHWFFCSFVLSLFSFVLSLVLLSLGVRYIRHCALKRYGYVCIYIYIYIYMYMCIYP